MRTFTLFLMIALLPVRIWAADGMAVGMAKMGVAVAVVQDAQTLRPQTANMPGDCPMMAVDQADHGGENDGRSAAHCMACHLCAPTAAQSDLSVARCPVPPGQAAARVSSYSDANLAPDLRPPIS